MKRKISEIPGYFKIEILKNDKRIVIFLVCLLIATIFWFLNALSKDYTTTVSYPVKFINPPPNQFVSNNLPSRLELQVQAHGFTLLRHKLSISLSPIVINLTEITSDIESSSGRYSIRTANLLNIVSDQTSKEVTVSSIRPEYFSVILDSLKTKSIPVMLNANITFKSQYNLKNQVNITPDSVSITGPAILLDSVHFLETEFRSFESLDAGTEGQLTVNHPANTSVKPEKVHVEIPVERFTEKELKIPVRIKNKPDTEKIKLFPADISVTFLVGLSEFENVTASDIVASIDYNAIQNNTESVEVIIEERPSFIEILRYAPQTVEYLIETD